MRMWIVSIGEILNVMKSVYCKHMLHYSENTVFTLSRLVSVDWMISLVLIKVEPHSLKIRSHSHATGSPSSHPNDVPDFRSAGCSSVSLHTQLLNHYSTIDSVSPCTPLPNYPRLSFPSSLPPFTSPPLPLPLPDERHSLFYSPYPPLFLPRFYIPRPIPSCAPPSLCCRTLSPRRPHPTN